MKKRHSLFPLAVLIGLMTCLSSITAWANPIGVEQARQAALSFRKSTMSVGKHRAQMATSRLNHCFTKHTMTGSPAVYAFEQEGGGFVLAAADDAMPSVLGYSDTGSFDPNNIPDGLQYLLDEYARMAASAPRKAGEQNLPTPDYPVVVTDPIDPLVKTHWGQTKCYNRYTPFALTNADGNGHASTGCVTTALAQIMRYHEWPVKGFGSAYQDAKQGLTSVTYIQNFYDHAYRWDLMYENTSQYRKNENNVYSTQFAEVDAVSQLMVDVAVALRTEFGAVSSSVHIAVIPALTSYFNYDSGAELVQIDKVGVEAFNNKLIDELKAKRPVFLAGGPNNSGHAFVCDGYDGQGRFHINWGWENLSDGYYLITGLTPAKEGVGGYGTGYSQSLKMVCNIKKPTDGDVARPEFVISYRNEGNPGYSVKESGGTQYFAADFGVTHNRHIRGRLGMLVVDAQGQGQIVWNQHEEYSQILSLGTQGSYFGFRVNVNPEWLLPGTRAYYIYRECGEDNSTWHYVKDTNGRYCGFDISLVNGDVKYNRITSQPDYNGTPGQQTVTTTHTFTLGKKVTDHSQIKSNHVYAIARHQGGFAALNPQNATLKAVSEFDASGSTAFVISGDDTNGYTIKSAVAKVYMPVLQTSVANGTTVVMGTVAEKFMIEDRIEYNYATGVQIRSLNSSYNGSKGNVYLNCGGVGNNFVGWYNQSGANTQMDLYEVLVDGMETMPVDVSGPVVVTYKIYQDDKLIGEKRYPETIGRVPTTDFIPYFVTAEGFPATITGETTSYDIHTTYNDHMPFVPNKKLYNVRFVKEGASSWWTYNNSQNYCQLTGTQPAATDTKAQWVITGNWMTGFSIVHYSTKKTLVAYNEGGLKPYLAMSADMFPNTFMLEPTDEGFCFHLKENTLYLSNGGNNAAFNSTKENLNNLVDFVEPGKEPALSLSIGNMEYSTFYDSYPRKIPAGITAYYCTERSDGKLQSEEIKEGVIPAATGVVLSGIPGTYRFAQADETSETCAGSCLSGVTEDKPVSAVMSTSVSNVYVFSRVDGQFGFYKYSNTATLQAHKAYYAPTSGVEVKGFVLDFEGEQTTAIDEVTANANANADPGCYDLQGRSYVRMPKSGIYIKNGRKVMVR